jgi:hypothetical protein
LISNNNKAVSFGKILVISTTYDLQLTDEPIPKKNMPFHKRLLSLLLHEIVQGDITSRSEKDKKDSQ